MNVYVDTSALNRIFDDQSQIKIFLEASAMLILFSLLENGVIMIVSSDALKFETERNPYPERKKFVEAVLQESVEFQAFNSETVKRAKELESSNIKGLDALHLACAEQLSTMYFVTCDERLMKRYQGLVTAINPIDFVNLLIEEDSDEVK